MTIIVNRTGSEVIISLEIAISKEMTSENYKLEGSRT